MPVIRPNASALRATLTQPAFYTRASFELAPAIAEALLQVARVPHAYGFAYSAIGSAPHLLEFEGVDGFDGMMSADGLDADDASMALRRCLFELMERIWCFATPPDDRVTRAARRDLGAEALDPVEFGLLAEFEYARQRDTFVRYADELALDWLPCRALTAEAGADTRLAPVSLVYQGYGHRHPQQRFVPVLSTGLAAGTRYDAALMRGLCEVIERDAFMIRWLGRLPPSTIPEGEALLAGTGAEIAAALTEDGFSLSVHDLTIDVPVPVLMVALKNERRDEKPATALGLGCDPSPSVALEKALREALTMMSNWFEFPGGSAVERNDATSGATPPQTAALESFLGGAPASDERSANLADQSDAAMPGKFLTLVDTLTAEGLSAWYGDLTPGEPGVEGDFVLVRALIPGLQPMLYERDCWRLGNPRLMERLERLGGDAPPRSVESLNLELHPLAIEVVA